MRYSYPEFQSHRPVNPGSPWNGKYYPNNRQAIFTSVWQRFGLALLEHNDGCLKAYCDPLLPFEKYNETWFSGVCFVLTVENEKEHTSA